MNVYTPFGSIVTPRYSLSRENTLTVRLCSEVTTDEFFVDAQWHIAVP